MSDQIAQLKTAIEKRNEKIADVDGRLERQNDHISKIENSRARYLEHRERWIKQNERDQKKIDDLLNESVSPNEDLSKELGVDPEELDNPDAV